MAIVSNTNNALAADSRSLNALKMNAGQANNPAAIKETAKQFESLFMREVIKSMREATMKSGLDDGAGTQLGTDLLDQQLSVSMSGLPGGISEMIEKQLTRQAASSQGAGAGAKKDTVAIASPAAGKTPAYTPTVKTGSPANAVPAAFVQKLNAAATEVERSSGLPASFMVGQAGHETGWGKHEIRNADGTSSFNLFGIKAGAGWTGKVATVTTTEYIDGEPKKVVAKFRAYSSYEESFADYAKMINQSPRYAQARTQTASAQGYAMGLQRAGYATDPQYATKLSRAINMAAQLRAQA